MKNSYYVVNGIDVRFVKAQIFEDNKTVRLFTSARPFDVAFDDMPEFLRTWIPIEMEGVQSYDHTAAEMGVKLPPDNLGLTVNEKDEPQDDEDEESEQVVRLRTLYAEMMEGTVKSAEFLKEKLKDAIMNLKDEKTTTNNTWIEQSKQISNAAKVSNDITKTSLEAFIQGIKLFEGQKKRKGKKKK